MGLAKWLQLAGGVCEFLGLVFVAAGITRTRRRFTRDPSIVQKSWSAVTRFVGRFRRREHRVVTGSAHMTLGALTSKARGRVSLGAWDDVDLEERVERLKEHMARHEKELDGILDQIDREAADRTAADDLERQLRESQDQELKDLVEEAAAGDLRLETLGVGLFVLGIILQTWGNMIQ